MDEIAEYAVKAKNFSDQIMAFFQELTRGVPLLPQCALIATLPSSAPYGEEGGRQADPGVGPTPAGDHRGTATKRRPAFLVCGTSSFQIRTADPQIGSALQLLHAAKRGIPSPHRLYHLLWCSTVPKMLRDQCALLGI